MAPPAPDLREAGGGGVTATRRQAALGRVCRQNYRSFIGLLKGFAESLERLYVYRIDL